MTEGRQFQITHRAMGTIMTHKAFGGEAQHCLIVVNEEIDRLERLLSRFIPESEVRKINDGSGISSGETLSQPVFEVLMQSVEISERARGLFDVTIGPLVDLWCQSKVSGCPPSQENIDLTLTLVNTQDLILDPYRLTARLLLPGQAIDLGGIGKGYAGDQVTRLFREFGGTSAFSNIGGNVVTVGAKPDGSPWWVGIQHPRQPQEVIGVVAVTDRTVVTSGDYQRSYLPSRDYRYHHILDPRTGFPAQSGLASVTIVAEQGIVADALSTTLFIAGLEGAMEILSDFPGVEAVFIDRDLQVFVTSGLETCFHPQTNVVTNKI